MLLDEEGESPFTGLLRVEAASDEIHLGAGQRLRVVDLVPFDEEDESPFVGLLQVEAA